MNFRKIAIAAIRSVITEEMVTEAIYNIVREGDVQEEMEENDAFKEKVYDYISDAIEEEIESY